MPVVPSRNSAPTLRRIFGVHALQNAAFEIRGIQSEGNSHYYIYQAGENEAMSALTEISGIRSGIS